MTLSKRSICGLLTAIVLIGVLARIGLMVAMHRWDNPNAIEHRQLAVSLLENGTFSFREGMFDHYGPSSVQSPPYPFVLATIFKIFGKETDAAYAAAMVLNSIVSGIGIWLLYKLVIEIGGKPAVALLAALLMALWPSQVYASSQAQAIAMIITAVVAMLYCFARAVRTGDAAPWIGYSVIGTIAALTEPVLLPILAFSGLLILIWPGNLNFSRRIRNACILLAAAVLFILPWTVRNRTVHGQWIPIKSTFWVNVWKGNNPNATGTDRVELTAERKKQLGVKAFSLSTDKYTDPRLDNLHQYDLLTPEQRDELRGKNEADREKIFAKYAKTWIAENPEQYIRLSLKRLWMSLWLDLDNPKASNALYIVGRSLLLPVSLIGILIAVRKRWKLAFPLLVWASCLLTYTLTVTANRFSLPFEPLQLTFLALLLSPIAERVVKFREPEGFPVEMNTAR